MTRYARSRYAEIVAILALIAIGVAPPARALDQDWRLHGFASQRLTLTSGDNNFFGDTAGRLSAAYSEVGAGFSWRPDTQWLLSGQAIYRRGGASEEGRVEPDYLFLEYTPFASQTGSVAVELGKIKVPYGLYNELRDTPMTRPGILPPQSFYLDSLRRFNQSAFGLHLDLKQDWRDETLSLRYSQIKPDVSGDNAYWSFVGNPALFNGTLHSGAREASAGQLGIEHDGGRLRALLSHASGPIFYRPNAGDLWSGGRFDFSFTALSLQWNGPSLSLSWEKTRNVFKNHFSSASPPFPPDVDTKSDGASEYLQAEWRFAPRWIGLLRHDRNYLDKNDRDGAVFAANNPGYPAWSRFAKDWTLGVRYRADAHWLLAAEFHRVHGTSWLPPADNLSNGAWAPGNTSEHWNMLLLQASYLF